MRKITLFSMALLLALSIGYAAAWQARDTCASSAASSLVEDGISARTPFGEELTLDREIIFAKVALPFIVDTRAMLPHGRGLSLHLNRYLALPLKTCILISKRSF